MNKYFLQIFFAPYIKKRLLGKDYINFNDFHNQSYIISQYCLTLGYIYRNNFEIFVNLITQPNADVTKASLRVGKMGESLYENFFDETDYVYDFFIKSQKQRYNELLNLNSKSKIDYDTEAYLKNQNKLPTSVIPILTDMLSYSFIGFGYKYPDLTLQLLDKKNEESIIESAIESGLDISKENLHININDRINSTKELIKPYVLKYNPELLKKLNLE